MKINYSRFKVAMLGFIGIFLTIWVSIKFFQTTVAFTSFETIVICFFIIQQLFISMFFMFWGMEPYTSNFEIFEKKKGDLKE